MLYYTLKRLALAALVALTVSFISFGLLYLSSDPAIAMAGETASDADIEAIRQLYGFDRPILVQYFDWLQRAAAGDLGKSYYFRTDVSALIGERLPTTMTLGVCAITFAILLSVPLGVAAAIRPNLAAQPGRLPHQPMPQVHRQYRHLAPPKCVTHSPQASANLAYLDKQKK